MQIQIIEKPTYYCIAMMDRDGNPWMVSNKKWRTADDARLEIAEFSQFLTEEIIKMSYTLEPSE